MRTEPRRLAGILLLIVPTVGFGGIDSYAPFINDGKLQYRDVNESSAVAAIKQ